MSQVQELRQLPVELVVPSRSQPRRHFREEALKALAGSIRERGVLQPVLVHPLREGKYELVAGERRWRAAQIAGLRSVPALVGTYDDREALEAALIENMAREDLNPVEQARACVTLKQEFGLTYRQIAESVGCHETTVSHLGRLLQLSEEILELLERGELTGHHGTALLRAEDPQARGALARAAVQEGWTVRTLDARVHASNTDALVADDPGEREPDGRQTHDLAGMNLATAWGELLGAEVKVRPLPGGRMRIEVLFDSAADGIALADRLGAAIAKGSKGR